jgi:hypothetical protein
MMRGWLAAALLLCLGCDSPCKSLADKLCTCDQSRERNRRACATAGDTVARRRAESLARQTGVDPRAVCQQALRAFRCPE